MRTDLLAVLLMAGAGLIHGSGVLPKYLGICSMQDVVQGRDPEVDRYFYPGGPSLDIDLACAARATAEGRALTPGELSALAGKIDMRAGDDITLLNFAALKQNLAVIDQLLEAGADPTLPLKTSGPDAYDSFISLVARGSRPVATEMLKLYLDHGGDPDLKAGVNNTPLAASAALMSNVESFKALTDAGADLWQPEGPTRYSREGPVPQSQLDQSQVEPHSAPIFIAAKTSAQNGFANLEYAIEHGGVEDARPDQIEMLIDWISFYTFRDDEISRNIVGSVRQVIERTRYPGDARSSEVLAFGERHGW
jgi:hypothetical protein